MGLFRRMLIVSVAVLSWYIATRLNKTPQLPTLNPDAWWGPGEPREQNTKIRPFKIDIPKQVIYDKVIVLLVEKLHFLY